MSAADGTVVGTTKIVDHGSPAERLNIVLLAEGYTQAELPQFHTDAQEFADRLFEFAPFDQYQCAINIFRVDVASDESGANDPVACGGPGTTPKTYFDATFCGDGKIRRLLTASGAIARDVADAEVPEWHQLVIIVNSPVRGGSGGSIAVTSTGGGDWREVAIHELGHALFGLADEYNYWAGCGEAGHDNHPAAEPAAPNVTTNSDKATIKWASLIAPATPVPTMANPDCTTCDGSASPVPAGTVGAFEGAHYYKCGAYRPEYSCMMRSTSQPFCAVCQSEIRKTLSPYLADCYAPVFSGIGIDGIGGVIVCILTRLAYVMAAVALLILIWIPGIWCLVKQLFFRASHCMDGNDDPCHEL